MIQTFPPGVGTKRQSGEYLEMEVFTTVLGRIRSLFAKRNSCPSCGKPAGEGNLEFKRFLSKKEAELLEKTVRLNSHFVHACPHCGGDILDIKGRK